MTAVRVVAVLTHPIQYYAPWFRWIQANRRDIDLHVIYASQPSPRQQGAGFTTDFAWDVPLTEGYPCRIVRPALAADRFDSEHFWGLNVPEIDEAIRDASPEVVVVFGWYSITLIRAIRAARRLGVPVLYHGDINLRSAPRGWRSPVWTMKTRRLLGRFDGWLSVGTRSAAFLRFFGVPDDRLFATPHGVDVDRFATGARVRACAVQRAAARASFGLSGDRFTVLFAGKLEPKKHPLDLVEALGRMEPRPHLVVAGGGPLEADVREAAQRAGIGVSMLGFVNQSRMPELYAAADCLALPSDARETWGLVVNEALAAGLPCVLADQVGCAPDLGGTETGAVYATDDPALAVERLAEALTSVRDRLASGHDFASACQARSATHTFVESAAGLATACRAVFAREVAARDDHATAPRVIACCGGMVLVGGLERMTFEILRVLRSRGAVVHCVVNSWDSSRIIGLAEQLGASWSTGFYFHQFTLHLKSPLAAARICGDMLRTSGGLLRDAWRFRATHVFVSDYVTALRNAPALLLMRLAGRRVILRLGNAPDRGRLFTALWRFGIGPVVDVFVCNSAFTERELAAHGIPLSKRLTIVHTPPTRTPTTAEPAVRDCHRLVYAGQLIPEKGADLLLDALGLLVARGYDLRLDIAGELHTWGPPDHMAFRTALLERAGAGDLEGRVRFLGFREDVPQLMGVSAMHCMPSRAKQREAFGIVVIEAKQAGIPSVVMRSGNLPDLVSHGEDGFICRAETAEALAEGIEYFLQDGRLERAMAAARRSAVRFGRERFETAWRGVFSGGDVHAF